MAITEFGVLLKQLLDDAGKTQKQIAEKIAEKKGGEIGAIKVAESNITRYVTGTKLPDGEDTVDSQMSDLFPVLISEHVVTSEVQVRELISKIPFKHEKLNQTRKHVVDSIRGMLESEVLALLEKQQALDRPRYYTGQGIEFIGREEAIENIIDLLHNKKVDKFLTLVGLPGVGKTELAEQVGDEAKARGLYAQVEFLPIETTLTAVELLEAINKKLLGIDLKQPTLLILDNCEQVEKLKEAEKLIRQFLKSHPNLTILATSRHDFSYPYTVNTLSIPDAVQLFLNGIERYQGKPYERADEDAHLIVEICELLGGLPLALLIASALISKGMKGIYDSILDMSIQGSKSPYEEPERHVSLEALINYSYKTLSDEEKKLLRWIAAFSSNIPITSILNVCSFNQFFSFSPKNEQEKSTYITDIENLLNKLKRHHLLTYQENIVGMHNTIRRFCRRILNTIDETDYLFSYLLRWNCYCREKTYLHSYEDKQIKERLLWIAKDRHFLENGDEKEEDIKEGLDKILFSLDGTNYFRRHGSNYPVLLHKAAKAYLNLRIGLEETDDLDEPFDHKILTAEQRREMFFWIFDDFYKVNLYTMLVAEANGFLYALFQISDIGRKWETWDFHTHDLAGLTAKDYYMLGAPGSMMEADPSNICVYPNRNAMSD